MSNFSAAPQSESFLDQTIAVWQPYTERALTQEDAREIAHNMTSFFHLLLEWNLEERVSNSKEDRRP